MSVSLYFANKFENKSRTFFHKICCEQKLRALFSQNFLRTYNARPVFAKKQQNKNEKNKKRMSS